MQLKKSLIFLFIVLLGFSPSAFALDFTYTESGGTITITGYTGPDGAVEIPNTIEGKKVVSIGDYAFAYKSTITSIIIPENVTNLGNGAFYGCTGLPTVTLPDNLTSIGYDVFASCTGLTGTITIPKKVISISYGVFASCTLLTAINVNGDNPSYSSQDGVLYDKLKTELIQYPAGKAGAFTIPSTVSMIRRAGFYGSTGLTSVVFPASVTGMGEGPFRFCSGLLEITVAAGNTFYSSDGGGVLYNKGKTELIVYPAGKSGSFSIPVSVEDIANNSFFHCSGLTGLSIPVSVKTIGVSAFSFCSGLTTLTLPGNIQTIGGWAFEYCSGLTSINIPSSVTSIGASAFSNCSILASAYFYGNAQTMGGGIFDGCATGFTVYHIAGSTGFTDPWNTYTTAIFVPSSTTTTTAPTTTTTALTTTTTALTTSTTALTTTTSALTTSTTALTTTTSALTTSTTVLTTTTSSMTTTTIKPVTTTTSICIEHSYYRDEDNDTYGNTNITTISCAAPEGYVDNSTGFDCDDSDPGIYMGCDANPCSLKIVPSKIARLYAYQNQYVMYVVYAERNSDVTFSQPATIDWTTEAIENVFEANIGKRIILGILLAHPNILKGGEVQAIVSCNEKSAQECGTINVK